MPLPPAAAATAKWVPTAKELVEDVHRIPLHESDCSEGSIQWPACMNWAEG